MKKTALFAVLVFAVALAAGQSPSPSPSPTPAAIPIPPTNNPLLQNYSREINDVLRTSGDDRTNAIEKLLDLGKPRRFVEFVFANHQQDVRDQLANQVEQSRLDEQFGAGPNSSGSASAVAKAGVASLLSLAVESGAITQSLNGNTAVVAGNADGVLHFLTGGEPFPYCPPVATIGPRAVYKSCGTPVLKDLGFNVSFDMDQGATTTAATSPTGNPAGTPPTVNILSGHNRFSGASLKYVFRNPPDVRSKDFQQQWSKYYNDTRTSFQQAGNQLLDALIGALGNLIGSPDYDTINKQYAKALANSPNDRATVERIFLQYLNHLVTAGRKLTPNFDSQIANAITAYMRYSGTVRPLLETINSKAVFSAEWDFQRPLGQPDLQHFRVLSTLNPFGANGSLNINLAGTIYNSSSVSAQFGRWRDAQASMQLERRVGGDLANYPARFSLAGYFQYMISPGLISLDQSNFAPGTTIQLPQAAAIALAPTGPIWVAEAKVTFKLKGSGAEIPLGITRSNRTDLIKATSTRGHIGITYDLDKLFTNK